MPNWCYNKIVISSDGDKAKFKAFCDSLKDEDGEYVFSFKTHVPRPPSQDDNWYTWNSTNWGTKWGAEEADVSMIHGKLHVNCSTAWSPPIAWARIVSIEFGVKIKITYEEPGMNFQGEYSRSSAGEVDDIWEMEHETEESDEEDVEVQQEDKCNCGQPCDAKPSDCSCACHTEIL